MEKLHQLKN